MAERKRKSSGCIIDVEGRVQRADNEVREIWVPHVGSGRAAASLSLSLSKAVGKLV